MRITAKVTGVKDVLKAFRQFGEQGEKVLAEVTEVTALEMQAEAKRNAPVDLGKLRQGIISEKVQELLYRIVALAPYSAYQEFGTGTFVDVPEGFESQAVQWKGRGIKKLNLTPQPFMYPAFLLGRRIYRKDLETALNALIKKNG